MTTFPQKLLSWHTAHGRKDLPWQIDPTPYRVWVSEIMLQQTQVNTVIPYYTRFMERFATIRHLADANRDAILHLWSGLGYYARARNLHKTAQLIRDTHNGDFPASFEALTKLPGIGRSTAGAILSLACEQRHAILDGNVKRVLTRYHAVDGWPGKSSVLNELWRLAESHTPTRRVAQYTQAIMDLGATVCTRSKPQCGSCPFEEDCEAHQRRRETDFPTARPKKTLPVRQTTFIMMRDPGGAVMLKRRPPSGVWGGLWSFPECKAPQNVETHCNEKFGFAVTSIQAWPRLRHTFSHFHLDITPIEAHGTASADQVMEANETLWYNNDTKTPLGFAAPVSKLLSGLFEEVLGDPS